VHFCYVVKIIGHQWYWSYEIVDVSVNVNNTTNILENIEEFDSYMLPIDELKVNSLRLLEVDNSLLLPVDFPIKFLITSDDVIHSWAVPSLGIKVDAVPGRLNQIFTIINRIGTFYGQCSELCGIQHGFMPIKVESFFETNRVLLEEILEK